MPNPTAGNLASLFRSAARLTFNRSSSAAAAVAKKKKKKNENKKLKSHSSSSSTANASKDPSSDAKLKSYITSIECSSSSSTSTSKPSDSARRLLRNFKAPPSSSVSNSSSALHNIVTDSLADKCRITDGESAEQNLSNLLGGELDSDCDDENESGGKVLEMPWLAQMDNDMISLQRKDPARNKREKFSFKTTQTSRFGNLVRTCADRLGTDAAMKVFGKMGCKTGVKEYNALIRTCIEKARDATDEETSLQLTYKAYQIFKEMRENGFVIEEETYGPFMLYLIDFGMVEEFFLFHELIQDKNPDSVTRLAYYEMLLWCKLDNEEKIQELFNSAMADSAEEKHFLQGQLLLALCESERKKEALMLLETVDILKFTSVASLVCLFKFLGKFILECFAERFLLALKTNDIGSDDVSKLVCEYAINIPNLTVKEIIIKFQALHAKLEIFPTSAQYGRLIKYACVLLKVHEALNLVDEAFGSGVDVSLEAIHAILEACDRSCDFNLVHRINLMIHRQNLQPNKDTYRLMILLYAKMKDFEGAHGLINDLKRLDLEPTAGMYNIILSGYFREKNIPSALRILKQMEDANVKPDALTFSYLIANSHCEKDINKFYDAMNDSGIQPTKHIFMALINAYAACGQFEKAKKVLLDKRIPVKSRSEIKSVLIGALAGNGQMTSALEIYEEAKEMECKVEPKAIRSLVEHFQSEGELNKSLQLLEELNGSAYWVDACFRIISSCLQQENLRCTVDLLKQLKNKFVDAEVEREVLFDEGFCLLAEKEATNMQFGLSLLQAVKEELGVCPSRKSLDFLLTACATAKDSKAAFIVWKEYETAKLPYNVLSYLRMYLALLASGDQKSAAVIVNKIPKDDPHVRAIIRACEGTYLKFSETKKKMKRKKKLVATLELLEELDAKIG